jgi:cytochrome b pre-mRNA-processing protein 3
MDFAPAVSLFQRLFKSEPDPREDLRPLWHRIVAISREPALYRDDGVADMVAGRFDMITAILALVLLRLERDGLAQDNVLLTELFVADMDAQLRESGVGDIVVGKHVGKLMSALGGRLGAIREALASEDAAAFAAALARNTTMAEGRDTAALARRLLGFRDKLAALDNAALLAGEIAL